MPATKSEPEQQPATLRTVEFGLYPTRPQAQQLEAWLELQRRIWNYGLALLQELDDYMPHYKDPDNKLPAGRYPACPLPWETRAIHPDYDKGKPPEKWFLFGARPRPGCEWIFIPRCHVGFKKDQVPSGSCPVPQSWREPRLKNTSYFGLASFFAKKNHPNWPELQGCPNSLIRGTLQALAVAWKESRSGKRDALGRRRKPPRFKGRRFPITTLSDTDCKATAHVEGDCVRLPRLGSVRIKGNRDGRRFPIGATVSTFRIQREPSGWFLLLVGAFQPPCVRRTTLKVGLDAGVAHTLTSSTGKQIDGPAALAASLRKLERLQQQMARQDKGGANWRKTVAKIARLHEKIRRTRKLFAHKTTTFLLRTYGDLVLEDLKLQNMTRTPAPKPAEDGKTFLPNQAAAKAGLNRAILDQGLGQLRTMLQAKAKDRGRGVHLVNPAHTSQACSCCGHTSAENRRSQELFRCQRCGFSANADANAAVNILRSQFPDERVPLAPAPLSSDVDQLVLLTAPSRRRRRTERRRQRPPATVVVKAEQQLALF